MPVKESMISHMPLQVNWPRIRPRKIGRAVRNARRPPKRTMPSFSAQQMRAESQIWSMIQVVPGKSGGRATDVPLAHNGQEKHDPGTEALQQQPASGDAVVGLFILSGDT